MSYEQTQAAWFLGGCALIGACVGILVVISRG